VVNGDLGFLKLDQLTAVCFFLVLSVFLIFFSSPSTQITRCKVEKFTAFNYTPSSFWTDLVVFLPDYSTGDKGFKLAGVTDILSRCKQIASSFLTNVDVLLYSSFKFSEVAWKLCKQGRYRCPWRLSCRRSCGPCQNLPAWPKHLIKESTQVNQTWLSTNKFWSDDHVTCQRWNWTAASPLPSRKITELLLAQISQPYWWTVGAWSVVAGNTIGRKGKRVQTSRVVSLKPVLCQPLDLLSIFQREWTAISQSIECDERRPEVDTSAWNPRRLRFWRITMLRRLDCFTIRTTWKQLIQRTKCGGVKKFLVFERRCLVSTSENQETRLFDRDVREVKPWKLETPRKSPAKGLFVRRWTLGQFQLRTGKLLVWYI